MNEPPLSFTLRGRMKSGKNHVQITRTGHRYPKKGFADWRDKMLAQMPRLAGPIVSPVALTVSYVPGDRLRRDVPGILDALCHLLEKAGLVADDAQVKNVYWEQGEMDRGNPHCVVTIRPLHGVDG